MAPTPTPTPSPTESPSWADSTPSGPPIVAASPGVGKQVLVLSDAFDAGEWTAGSYTPANETAAVDAMATSVDCYTDELKPVEFRFARVEGTLLVQVAQDMRSENPDMEMEFALVADGRQVTTKNINFTSKAELSTDLAGVTVLRIGVRAAPGECRNSDRASALITSVVVEQ